MKKAEQLSRITSESVPIHKWECPVCCSEYRGEEGQTLDEFSQSLYKLKVRYKVLKYMQGVFCSECYNDKEVQNSTL